MYNDSPFIKNFIVYAPKDTAINIRAASLAQEKKKSPFFPNQVMTILSPYSKNKHALLCLSFAFRKEGKERGERIA